MSYTPGPWTKREKEIAPGEYVFDVFAIGGAHVADITADGAEGAAVARLIAEAPELYEYLRTALKWLDNLEKHYGHIGIVGSKPYDRAGRLAWRRAIKAVEEGDA